VTKKVWTVQELVFSGIWESLKDLEYADDLAMLSHSFNHVQEKTQYFEEVAVSARLRISKNR